MSNTDQSGRVIKFRAFQNGKMYYLESEEKGYNHYLQIGSGGFWLYDAEGQRKAATEDGGILMQFTGLKDKAGNEVYEDDRIRIYWRGEDDFSDETISYDDKYGYFKYGNNPVCELFDPETPFEVIGNIYELENTLNHV